MIFNKIYNRMMTLRQDESGASAVEYAILVGIIGAALSVAAQTFGTGLGAVFTGLLTKLNLS
jgi:pilus assembly protein Flp/PilA